MLDSVSAYWRINPKKEKKNDNDERRSKLRVLILFHFVSSSFILPPWPPHSPHPSITQASNCVCSVYREREREWARYLHRVLPSIERRAHGWVEYVIIIAYVTYLISFFFRLAFSVNPRQTNESKSMWNFHKQQQQRAGELLCRTRYGICHCSAR